MQQEELQRMVSQQSVLPPNPTLIAAQTNLMMKQLGQMELLQTQRAQLKQTGTISAKAMEGLMSAVGLSTAGLGLSSDGSGSGSSGLSSATSGSSSMGGVDAKPFIPSMQNPSMNANQHTPSLLLSGPAPPDAPVEDDPLLHPSLKDLNTSIITLEKTKESFLASCTKQQEIVDEWKAHRERHYTHVTKMQFDRSSITTEEQKAFNAMLIARREFCTFLKGLGGAVHKDFEQLRGKADEWFKGKEEVIWLFYWTR